MKAAVLEKKGLVRYQEAPKPAPGPGNVLLQVSAVSICGSDISRFAQGHRKYPIILGHECAGTIVEAGAGVGPETVGRRAALIPLIPCFHCKQCLLHHYSACHNYSFVGSRQDGGCADYVEIPATSVLELPAEIKFEEAALIEPSTVARHLLDLGNFAPGQTAIVLGAGSIGLFAVQWLRILGAGLIIATDIVDENLEIARKLGAHVTLNSRQVDVAAEVARRTGDGVDLALEVAGSPITLAQTVQVTRPRGAIVCGGNQPLDAHLPMSFVETLMRQELHLAGCFMSYSAPFPGHEWSDTLDAMRQGKLDMNIMISHRAPLSEMNHIMDEIASHRLIHRKIVLFPEEGMRHAPH